MTARALGLVLLAALCLSGAGVAEAADAAVAVAARASLTDVESQVMCVTCGVPLSIAESPQADQERSFIRAQIARGRTAAQIKRALVDQLGPAVLALPQRRGFNLAVYIVPVALIAVLAASLTLALIRWRRTPGDDDGGPGVDPPAPVELSAPDAARLDEELSRHPA